MPFTQFFRNPQFNRKFKVGGGKFGKFLYNVGSAAQVIILLYTGMRYSEVVSLKTGCIEKKDDIWLIKAFVIKNRRSNLPIDDEEWVAIDLVIDAVRVLEVLSRCTFNHYIFSSFETVKTYSNGTQEYPITNKGLESRLNLYLRAIDKKKKWKDWQLSPHQFRHGLIRQLARAEVGIPYITRQLHHYYTAISEVSYKINPSSLVYGMQKERLISNAVGLNAVREVSFDVMYDLFGEGKRFSGGGAAYHVERTEAFFTGAALGGEARKKYILELAKSGITMVRTGVGWCTRNHMNMSQDDTPPCIGDLNCNPHTCKHSIVPESRKNDVVRNYLDAIENIKDPQQIHLKKHWEKTRDSFKAMLLQLEVDPEKLLNS